MDAIKDPRLRTRLEKAGVRQLSKVAAETKHAFDTSVLEHLQEAAAPERAATLRRVRAEELVPGAKVKLRGIRRRGVVLSRQGADAVEVQIGSLRMRAKAEDVEEVEAVPRLLPETRKAKLETRFERTSTTEAPFDFAQGRPRTQRATEAELHVRGLRVEEALERVDKFLDEAVLAELTGVRIVHGIGTGALKKALSEFLASHPHVESFREAEHEHGGAGAMVITLKQNG